MTGAQLATALAALMTNAPPPKARRKGYHKEDFKNKPKKLTEADKAAHMAANDAECIKVFEAAGFKNIQPRVNVLTYDKWIKAGRKVKAKEKSQRVNKFALFHITQTEPLTAAVDSAVANSQPA